MTGLSQQQHRALAGLIRDTDRELERLRAFSRAVIEWTNKFPKSAMFMSSTELKQSELELMDIIDTFLTENDV